MKSIITKIISVLTIFTLCISLSACKTKDDKCASGHIWKLNSTTATCFDGGVESYECEVCKEIKTENVNAYGHDLVQSSYTAPTCKTNGEKVEKCSRCGFESKQTLLVVDHDYQVKYITPSTCTVKGSQTLECTMCHEAIVEVLELKTHNYQELESPIATCFANGSIINKCIDCQDEQFIENTSMLSHDFGTDGYCTKCGIYETLIDVDDLNVTHKIKRSYPWFDISGNLTPKFKVENSIPYTYFIDHQISLTTYLYDENGELLDYITTKSTINTWQGGYQNTMTLQYGGFVNGCANQFRLNYTPFYADLKVFSKETLQNAYSFKIVISCEGYKSIEKTFEITEEQ